MSRVFSDEIFKPEFRLVGPHLVEASAGTGKTYNIQNIYARLVIEKGLRVEEIQVMTYTDAATKELRDRIRKVLVGMANLYAGKTGSDFMTPAERTRYEKLRNCARENLGGTQADVKAQERVERALMEFDLSAISTIHGFCGRVLRRFAFETNGNFQSEIQNDKAVVVGRMIDDWWRNGCADAPKRFRESIDRGKLQGYASALSKKADWSVAAPHDEGAADWTLKKAAAFLEEYESERLVRETQTYDDLLRALRDALMDGERGRVLAARLRQEFKAALIDEFQDTDPVQYDIFRLIFLAPEALATSMLFFVGDPKQAIYAFRGGDIFAYKRAATSEAVKDNAYGLDCNHRSTPRLIAAINAIFGDRGTHRTFGDETIAYAGSLKATNKPGLKLANGEEDPAPFRIVRFSREAGGAASRERYVIQAVLETLSEQAQLKPRDIAILVGSNDAGKAFREELRKFGIPAVLLKSGNVFASAAASDLRQVLLVMAQVGGMRQIRTALATDIFGMSAKDIADEKKLSEGVRSINGLATTWQGKGFEAAIAEMETTTGFRKRLALRPDGERTLADLFQLFDLLGAATQSLGPSPDALVTWLTERINAAADEQDADEYARQLESERDALKIMTVHGSKGLEFPVVIVPVTRGMSASAPHFYHDERSALHVGLSEGEKRIAKAEHDAERTRYLYVAFTRASQRTIVIETGSGQNSPAGKLLANARANGAGENASNSPIRWINDPRLLSDAELKELERRDFGQQQKVALTDACEPRHYSHAPTKGSYSSLAPTGADEDGDGHDVDAKGGETAASADEHPIFALRGGKKTGTCWHAILEDVPFDIKEGPLLETVAQALRIHGCAAKGEAAAKDEAAVVADMIGKTLAYPLVSPTGARFALRDIRAADRLSEWEFDFSSAASAARTDEIAAILREEWGDEDAKKPFLEAIAGWNRYIPKGYFVGFQDLVFRHDGFYYVVDWKSNGLNRRKSGFTAAGVMREMADEGYFFQYLLYAVVLRKYLKETLGEGYSWERNFGGVRYYFLRGVAANSEAPVFADRPTERLLARLSEALGLEAK